jgi:hypothetical protein
MIALATLKLGIFLQWKCHIPEDQHVLQYTWHIVDIVWWLWGSSDTSCGGSEGLQTHRVVALRVFRHIVWVVALRVFRHIVWWLWGSSDTSYGGSEGLQTHRVVALRVFRHIVWWLWGSSDTLFQKLDHFPFSDTMKESLFSVGAVRSGQCQALL